MPHRHHQAIELVRSEMANEKLGTFEPGRRKRVGIEIISEAIRCIDTEGQ